MILFWWFRIKKLIVFVCSFFEKILEYQMNLFFYRRPLGQVLFMSGQKPVYPPGYVPNN